MRSRPVLTRLPAALEDPAAPSPAHTHRLRAVDRPRALPDWWAGDERPLVYLTFGSVAPGVGHFPGLYREAIAVLAGVDARLLVTVGEEQDPAALGPLPAGVHAER